jgi:cell division protein FtsW
VSTKQNTAGTRPGRKKLRVNVDNDYKLITCVLLLAGFGLVVLYSSSYYSEGISMLAKQAFFTGVGLVIMMVMAEFLDYRILKPWAVLLYVFSLGVTLLVLTPLGKTINGARRWINLGVTTFQPSELVKVTVILVIAGILSSYWKRLKKWQISAILFLIVMIPVGILFLVTDHLSAAVIVLAIGFGMVYIAHPKDRWMLLGVLFVLLLAVILIYYIVVLKEYHPDESFRYTRIRIWFDPFNEMYDGSYQVREGLYGIASGGLFGRGLGNSILKEGFLPEPYNDMIFAVLCEEMGLLGAAMVLYLFLYLVVRIFRIGVSAPDKFGFFICLGVMLHIASQVILNILVVTNTIMNTGITLCFFSGGGSALVLIYAEMGLVLSVAKRIQNPKI